MLNFSHLLKNLNHFNKCIHLFCFPSTSLPLQLSSKFTFIISHAYIPVEFTSTYFACVASSFIGMLKVPDLLSPISFAQGPEKYPVGSSTTMDNSGVDLLKPALLKYNKNGQDSGSSCILWAFILFRKNISCSGPEAAYIEKISTVFPGADWKTEKESKMIQKGKQRTERRKRDFFSRCEE